MTTSTGGALGPLIAAGDSLFDWNSGEFLFHAAVVAVAIAVLWAGVALGERWRIRRRLNARTPRALFRELCQAHELTRADRQLLTTVAQASPSEQCCQVFIDRKVIDEFTRAHPAEADECRYLSKRLFGSV
jgi:hypothetical protein